MKSLSNGAAKRHIPKAQEYESYFEKKKPDDFGLSDITQVLVVSDLHLGEGQLPDSAYWDRLENFTCDAEFEEFLQYKQDDTERIKLEPASPRERAWPSAQNEIILPEKKLLVLNGDFIDFLRVMRTPQKKNGESEASADNPKDELAEWRAWLEALLPHVPEEKKKQAIKNFEAFQTDWKKYVFGHRWRHYLLLLFSRRLRKIRRQKHYGLDAEDFKSVYRLEIVAQGHEKIFKALADWLDKGSALAIITGNHDQEMDQELVQAWFRQKLGATGARANRLQFFSQGLELCGQIRLEHGHRYEWHTKTETLDRGKETQVVILPPGSFFNRFFVNKIETVVPYLDNVRPVTRVIAYLFRSHTLEALGMLGQGAKAVLKLLLSCNGRALRFLGYSVLALAGALFTGFNFVAWGVLFGLANCRALVAHLLILLPAALLTGILIWVWNQIANRGAGLVAGLLHKPNALRRLAFFAIALLVFLLPLVDAIFWLKTTDKTLTWEILFQHWPASESIASDFFMWLLRSLKSSFQTIVQLLRPLAMMTFAAWGLKLLTEALRPHFNLTEVREKMTADWPEAAPRFATCGHTHIPDRQTWKEEKVTYLNSGTWNLVFEYESDVVRDDLSKTFVEFVLTEGKWEGDLWRWDPPKIRENKVVLLEPRKATTVRTEHVQTVTQ